METQTQTKTVERMSEAFAESSMKEDFSKWAERSIAHSTKENKEKQKKAAPREIKLAGRDADEREWIEKVGQKDESKDSAKESRRESASEKDDAANRTEQHAKESEKPDAKAGEKVAADDSPGEPLSGDLAERHWQGKLQGAELEKHIGRVNSRAGIILNHINQHPQKAQIEDGFRALMAGRPSGVDKPGFFRDLTTCLAEVASPAEVFHHITMQAEDREAIRACKNPKELRAAIQTIAKHYPGSSSSQASPKPRAPKPPSEVGGRGAAGDDGTRGETDFGSFSAKQSRLYMHGR